MALLAIENRRSVEIDFNQAETIQTEVFSHFVFESDAASAPDGLALVGGYSLLLRKGEAYQGGDPRTSGGIAIVDPTGEEKWRHHRLFRGNKIMAISSDKRKIAVQSTVEGVYYILRESGNVVILDPQAKDSLHAHSVGWSPDGNRIVYMRGKKILIVDIRSKETTELAEGSDPTWSPDGQWIAYRDPGDKGVLITPDGRSSRSVIDGKKVLGSLRWSPCNEYLLYAEAVNEHTRDTIMARRCRLWIHRLRDGAEYVAHPALSDGPALSYQWIVKK